MVAIMVMDCSHRFSDELVGLVTCQKERKCDECGAYQHTESYTSQVWIDGPMLSVEEFREMERRKRATD